MTDPLISAALAARGYAFARYAKYPHWLPSGSGTDHRLLWSVNFVD